VRAGGGQEDAGDGSGRLTVRVPVATTVNVSVVGSDAVVTTTVAVDDW
jgi:hypothetical protein